ncbi:MAG TPA: ATP-binding cassette domain-containing protein, partial [Pseudolabrys sp.]|nr:ATP-binding cassette domain-containing protein [Pseudolabrys sp.]
MPAVAIEFDDIGLTFTSATSAPTVALDAVTCRFEPGKVTALIGPSGCGKSTLLQIARGFLGPTQGRLRFVEPANGAITGRPAMSTVWQAFNLFPWLTIIENVAFGLDLAGVPR